MILLVYIIVLYSSDYGTGFRENSSTPGVFQYNYGGIGNRSIYPKNTACDVFLPQVYRLRFIWLFALPICRRNAY
jgi:hypothetical protein